MAINARAWLQVDEIREIILVVDDDSSTLRALSRQIGLLGYTVQAFQDPAEALEWLSDESAACLVVDLMMPGMTGLDMQARLSEVTGFLPIIFLSGMANIPSTVAAMRAGAIDFLEKPVERSDLAASIENALQLYRTQMGEDLKHASAKQRLSLLTQRQRAVFDLLLKGAANKEIAHELAISERTVKAHRQKVMEKLRASTLADVFAFAAELNLEISPLAKSGE